MLLSTESRDAIIDLIENRLSVMHIGDREDLRQVVALKKALTELRGTIGAMTQLSDIPTRGRRRKISALLEDYKEREAVQVV